MIFRQVFDHTSSTYTYILASGHGREGLIIDPVKELTPTYLTIFNQLDLKLVRAIDTHTHADHVTALGDLREATGCTTYMGKYSRAECVSVTVDEDEVIDADGIGLRSIYTPGHTNESFSFLLKNGGPSMVFTGDVLLIRGTGRTDFQGGDPYRSYDSIVNKLFRLDDETLVYPAHDYKGWTVSSIGEEQCYNPRLAGKSVEEYVEIMNNLNLPDPALMDAAIPANLACGRIQQAS